MAHGVAITSTFVFLLPFSFSSHSYRVLIFVCIFLNRHDSFFPALLNNKFLPDTQPLFFSPTTIHARCFSTESANWMQFFFVSLFCQSFVLFFFSKLNFKFVRDPDSFFCPFFYCLERLRLGINSQIRHDILDCCWRDNFDKKEINTQGDWSAKLLRLFTYKY